MGLFTHKSSKGSSKIPSANTDTNTGHGSGSHCDQQTTPTRHDSHQHTSNSSARLPFHKRQPNSGYAFRMAHVPDTPLPPAPNPDHDPAGYLRSIYAVRERSALVLEKAKQGQLRHFTVDMSKFADTANYVVSIIKRDFEPNYHEIPPHGRWQHFDVGGHPRVDHLLTSWPNTVDVHERTRRLLDLFLVSVLLDAGAGTQWRYTSEEGGEVYRRSEGLAVASLEMFKKGFFSSDLKQPYQVDSVALKKLTKDRLAEGLQVDEENQIAGLEGRTNLLVQLGDALLNKEIFGMEARPGNMLDYLLAHPTTQADSFPTIPLPTLWTTLMEGLTAIWPATRTKIDGVPLGDAWPCMSMPSNPSRPWENIVPFHKLTQWLTYSLMVPMQKLANVHFVGVELMTGLPEYRNGGLLVDTGLLTLKPEDRERGLEQYHNNATRKGQPNVEVVPLFTADDDVIVEWRALTIGFLDMLLDEVNTQLNLNGENKLSLAQMLEAGTWKRPLAVSRSKHQTLIPSGHIQCNHCARGLNIRAFEVHLRNNSLALDFGSRWFVPSRLQTLHSCLPYFRSLLRDVQPDHASVILLLYPAFPEDQVHSMACSRSMIEILIEPREIDLRTKAEGVASHTRSSCFIDPGKSQIM
nr:uracil catabolism protein 4 [Quercus suber]